MAASDPVPTVPTPTGGLQGVAAFSWDGSNWQPTGRAYGSVATPTGVLRGVAPFSWSGSQWTPAGRSMPGVPTPTGTLDGVALYTWSGSAWTPAGGAPDVPTPTGTLQGIAAFNWDGTAWQPAGQAAPEVATPSGVLQGVAMFSWSGTAWAAAPAPALSLSFMTPGTLDPNLTFTRASTATYFDNTGTMQTAAVNAPRWDYNPSTLQLNGLLIEESRTNLLLNSATLSTQSVTTTAVATTLSFYGTGSITRSGTSSGTTNGTGATIRTGVTFTPTAGTLTLTVSGSVTNAQLETGQSATSYIPTTGASATRAADNLSLPLGAWWTVGNGTIASEFLFPVPYSFNPPSNQYHWNLCDGAVSNQFALYQNAGTAQVATVNRVGGSVNWNTNVASVTGGTVTTDAAAWSGSGITAWVGSTSASTANVAAPAAYTTINIGRNSTSMYLNGYIRRLRYWNTALTTIPA